jgi:hypothetical protein
MRACPDKARETVDGDRPKARAISFMVAAVIVKKRLSQSARMHGTGKG